MVRLTNKTMRSCLCLFCVSGTDCSCVFLQGAAGASVPKHALDTAQAVLGDFQAAFKEAF